MGQVPAEAFTSGAIAPDRRPPPEPGSPRYLLVGDGKLARHLSFYLARLGLEHSQWSRRGADANALVRLAREATHVLLAVSDGAIEPLARVCATSSRDGAETAPSARRVHFSGSLVTPLASGAHPLSSFPATLFEPERYARVPFIIERGGPAFAELLPALPNPHFAIDPAQKARYHALCVLSGNFTVLLWTKFFDELARDFGIPRDMSREYLRAVARNLETEDFPMTGPLARGDSATIARNLAALDGDPYRDVYTAFVEAYRRTRPNPAPAPSPTRSEVSP